MLNFFDFSRQRYVLGDGAMEKMAVSNVLITGIGALGVEIGILEYSSLIC